MFSYTCNRRSRLWDYVEPGKAFCYFLRIVSLTCLVMPLSGNLDSKYEGYCVFLLHM